MNSSLVSSQTGFSVPLQRPIFGAFTPPKLRMQVWGGAPKPLPVRLHDGFVEASHLRYFPAMVLSAGAVTGINGGDAEHIIVRDCKGDSKQC